MDSHLAGEFKRIKKIRRTAMRARVAREALGASVVCVFGKGTTKSSKQHKTRAKPGHSWGEYKVKATGQF